MAEESAAEPESAAESESAVRASGCVNSLRGLAVAWRIGHERLVLPVHHPLVAQLAQSPRLVALRDEVETVDEVVRLEARVE